MKLTSIFVSSLLAAASIAEAAITVSLKNFTSASVGNPIVDSVGAAVAKNSIWASAGRP
jgi:hypothetical protein